MSEKYVVNVPVATVWTSPTSPREIDFIAISNDCNIKTWIATLQYESLIDLYDSNRVQTQVLYGEEVHVVEVVKEWASVIIPSQPSSKRAKGYPGWIPIAQLVVTPSLEKKKYDQIAIVTSKTAVLKKSEVQVEIELSYATILPVHLNEGDRVLVHTPTGLGIISAQDVVIGQSMKKGKNVDFIRSGEKFLGLPYLWAGMSSFGYDCSGFVYSICRANGYVIPRDAHDQVTKGKEIPITELKAGDVIFFAYEEGKGAIHHVGFYYGDGQMLHSPKTGRNIEIIKLEGTIYEKELCAARRYSTEDIR
ncbi:C40 family peptidase [Bacillus massiliigorillae]|uniref:C40 family peptidase n=1 Tax=Bacillus massiliigorillae TaxID=1243664 RepID=UPI0005A6F120|nr:C40 family peptidase [Bacillus massiliigorillae]